MPAVYQGHAYVIEGEDVRCIALHPCKEPGSLVRVMTYSLQEPCLHSLISVPIEKLKPLPMVYLHGASYPNC